MDRELHDAIVRTIKGLTIDAIEAANSGHPGLPMGMADVATVLWTQFLKHDPRRPDWHDRDRFVLSAGHGSMLLYSLLHLTGYDLPLDDLKRFRQLGSPTAGHPEYGDAPGIETTTGPLGQGFANGVGMAIAERYLAARFNGGSPEGRVLDHFTYAIVSDGDLMEGVASEAASLAGHLRLSKLVYLYDDNAITIDGSTDLAYSESAAQRFEAYGWHVQQIDGHDPEAIAQAIIAARAETERPSLIACKTIIGKGSPTWEGKSDIHSDAVGPEEVRRIKERVGLPPDEDFHIPSTVHQYFETDLARLRALTEAWDERFAGWQAEDEARASQWDATFNGELGDDLVEAMPTFEVGKADATRSVSGKVIQAAAEQLISLVGGSADLTPSNKTEIKGGGVQSPACPGGRNIHYGVREHAMAGIMNGLSLHGGVRPFAGTFMTFSDYMRPSIRLSALMHQPVIYVFTHDSIFLGEDGPTHQAVEHTAALRAIPNLTVYRPADGNEVVAAWLAALRRKDGPTAFALTRQKVPHLAETSVDGALRGGYVVFDPEGEGELEGILIGTGSELQLCLAAARALAADGRRVRCVSLPSWEVFESEPASYRNAVLPPEVTRRMAVEAGVRMGWERFIGLSGRCVTQDTFGKSAPWQDLAEHFGFTARRVQQEALA
ncbi:MAG: transketolase, partial [Planctomycetota bacterium]